MDTSVSKKFTALETTANTLSDFEDTSKNDENRVHFGEVIREALGNEYTSEEVLLELGMTQEQIDSARNGTPSGVDGPTRETVILVIAREMECRIQSAQEFLDSLENAPESVPISEVDWALDT